MKPTMKLKPCPFCGEVKDLQILNTGDLVGFDCHYNCEKQLGKIAALNHSWFVNCPMCGTCGPETYADYDREKARSIVTDDDCIELAQELWNNRNNAEVAE